MHESDISDTELQVGKFMLPKPGEKALYTTNQELYWHIGENDVSSYQASKWERLTIDP